MLFSKHSLKQVVREMVPMLDYFFVPPIIFGSAINSLEINLELQELAVECNYSVIKERMTMKNLLKNVYVVAL